MKRRAFLRGASAAGGAAFASRLWRPAEASRAGAVPEKRVLIEAAESLLPYQAAQLQKVVPSLSPGQYPLQVSVGGATSNAPPVSVQ